MKPYYTILLDSLRMLKSTAIFWVTLGISLLVALIYLSIGFDDEGMSLFFGLAPIENEFFKKGTPQSETLYVAIFTKLIAEYWLSWIAVLLALISCASIFPEALKEGSVYSFMVLIAVKTKSVMTALILTLVLWLVSSIIGAVEGTMYEVMQSDMFEQVATEGDEVEAASGGWYQKVVTAYAIFPKTGRTLDVADRLLVINGKRGVAKGDFSTIMMRLAFSGGEDVGISQEEIEMSERASERHSTGYAIGTSVIFAFVMLSLAAWIFCRKEISEGDLGGVQWLPKATLSATVFVSATATAGLGLGVSGLEAALSLEDGAYFDLAQRKPVGEGFGVVAGAGAVAEAV